MPRLWSCGLVLLVLLSLARDPSRSAAHLPTGDTRRIRLSASRQSDLDLEVGGELSGLPAGTTRYITRAELLELPQVTFRVSDDANFKESVEISGVLLEELSQAIGRPPADLIVAICSDGYRTNYPQAYVSAHHPVLALAINGQAPQQWPKDAAGHGAWQGPFLISHEHFKPSFKILAHQDEPQIPWGVIRLEFRSAQQVFSSIVPRGPHASAPSVRAGFRIAQQNCFRCHNMGAEGGTKSGRPWQVLAAWAEASSDRFAAYVRNPQKINAKSQMVPSPQYDDGTMRALIDYFKTFAAEPKP